MIPNSVFNLLINLIPMVTLFTFVLLILDFTIAIYTKEEIKIFKEGKKILYLVYVFILFSLVTTSDFASVSNNFIPLKEIMRYEMTSPLFYRNVIGNILLFVPFGYLITDMIKDKTNKINLLVSWIVIISTSTMIEIIQMFIGRSFDVDDIILNFIGGTLGFLVYCLFYLIYKIFPKKWMTYSVKIVIALLILFGILISILKFCGV